MVGSQPQVAFRRGLGHFSYMTARCTIIEIDGLWFRFSKLRNRRNSRGMSTLIGLLGAGVFQVLAGRDAVDMSERERIQYLGTLIASAKVTGGGARNPDVFESAYAELTAHSATTSGPEGVCFSQDQLEAGAAGWQPMVSLGTLDPYDQVDYMTSLAILWEAVKQNYRPTGAVIGTSAGTVPADATTLEESSPNTPKSGSRPPRTRPASGVSTG